MIDDIEPDEGTDRKFTVTDGGKLEENEESEANFEENLTFEG